MALNEISIETLDLDEMGSDNVSSINLDDGPSSGSSIPGIELLMNDKKSNKKKSKYDGNDDIDALENELNELSGITIDGLNKSNGSDGEKSSSLFGKSLVDDFKGNTDNTTWDGFGNINASTTEIPINPSIRNTSDLTKKSKGDLLKEKLQMLKKIEKLEKKGVRFSKKYDHNSSLDDMKAEFEAFVEDKERRDSVNFQGKMLMAAVTGIEMLNRKFDPFDFKLDGWTEQINENIDEYNDIFEELHEKYKSKAKMAPELKLLFQLGGSAIMLHMTNTMFKSSMPGMEDILRQNPELMNQVQQAAVNHMSQSHPGFGPFMNEMNYERQSRTRGPPPPMETQSRTPKTPRPDVSFARSNDLNGDGISLSDNAVRVDNQSKPPSRRPEMRGPRDISNILGNSNPPQQSNAAMVESPVEVVSSPSSSNKPSRTKRRPRSSPKNTMSLDL